MPISFFRNFPTKLSSFLFDGFVFSKKLLLKYPLLKILSKCILLLDDKAFKEIKNL